MNVVTSGKLARTLRQRKGLTLDQLAIEIGLSKSHLSRYERGEKALSVSSLMRLARSLGTSVAALLGEAPQKDSVHVVRFGDRVACDDDGYEFIPLARPDDVRSNAFMVCLPHLGVMGKDAQHEGEEMMFVVSGSVEVELPTQSVLLRKGDFAQFPGMMHHRLRGMEKNTEVLVVVTGMDT